MAATTLILPGSDAKPSKACKYWCKDGDKYYCCPSGKKSSWVSDDLTLWLPHLSYLWSLFATQRPSLVDWLWLDERHFHGHSVAMGHESEEMFNCPEFRPSCPRSLYEWQKPPELCDSDEQCDHGEKCCFDVCLDHKTCKPAVKAER